jgi:hypothetical protein
VHVSICLADAYEDYNCFGEVKGSESENATIAGENNVVCILYAKDIIIHHEFVVGKQTVSCKV